MSDKQQHETDAHLPSDPTLSYKPDDLDRMLEYALGEPPSPTPESTASSSGATPKSVGFEPFGGYKLNRMIAEGGAGEVWAADQCALSREVAIKRIRRQRLVAAAENERALHFILRQFEQEALTSANLEHPNILPVYDLSVDEAGHPILAMKRVHGTPWPLLLEEDFHALPVDDYLTRHIPILLDAAQAVAYAHSRGVIHRDIKPSQIMVGKFGEVLLMDWGLAIGFDGTPSSEVVDPIARLTGLPTLLKASSPAGTPAYMAPEQTESTARKVGPWTDVYLLGGTLFYVLTGKPPHPLGASEAVFRSARDGVIIPMEEAAPGRAIPSELKRLVSDSVNPNRAKRIQSAQEFVSRLQDYISGTSKRKDSARITAEVSASIERGGKEYREYGEALGALGNAGILWPRNPDIPKLRTRALVEYTRAAIKNRDLSMARAQAEQIEDGPEREKLLRTIEERERQMAQRERQRRVARKLAIVLLIATLIGAAVAVNQARRAQSALAEARLQQDIAETMGKKAGREQYFAAIGYANATLPQYNTRRIRQLLDSITPGLRGWEWSYLEQAIASEKQRLETPYQLLGVGYSHDGSLIAISAETPQMILYNPQTDEQRLFLGHEDKIYYLEFSHDDKQIATASKDYTIRLWDVETGETERILEGHTSFANSVTYHPTEPKLLSASSDGTIKFWDLESGDVDTLAITNDVLSSAFYNREGDRAIVAGSGSVLWIVDVEKHQIISEIQTGASETFTCARFSPDDRFIAASGWKGKVYVHDAGTGERVYTLGAHEDTVYRFVFTPDSKRLITPSSDHTIGVWSLESGELLYRIVGHEAAVWSADVAPDGQTIATVSYDHTLRLWELEKMDPRAYFLEESELPEDRSQIESARIFYTDDTSLTSVDDVWDVEAGRTYVRVRDDVYEIQHGASMFTPDGNYRIMLNANGRVVDTASGAEVARLAPHPVTEGDISPDGKYVALAGDAVNVYTTENWEHHFTVPHSAGVRQLTFDPSSRLLALNTQNSITQIWNIETLERVSILGGSQWMGLFALEFSPDSQYIATGHSPSYLVKVWHVDTGEEAYRMVGHSFRLFGIDFSPDGSRIATISWDNSLRLWEAGTGREVLVPHRKFEGYLLAVKFSKDGKRLYAPTSSGQIEVWEAK